MARLADLPFREFPDRDAWRTWLAGHHESCGGIWLAVGKKGNPVTTLTYDDAVEEALCFGWIDSTTNRLDEHRFKQLFTPRRPGGTWSRSNKERVARLSAAGLMEPAGLRAVEEAKADGSWTFLDDIEALVVPADLAEALEADPAAAAGFAGLTDGRKKLSLYWIATAKREDTRAHRVAKVVEAARAGRPAV